MQYFGRSFIYNTLWSLQGFFIQDFPPVRSPGRRERSAACDAAPGFIATVLSRICGNIVLGGPDGPMMNFYEEFGVRNDASVEEIRQAYKTLARVLHPDSQMDEKLRAAAACQMKRLHEILDIFLDPRKRRAYDESLAAAAYPNAALHWAPPEAAEPSVRPLDKFEFAQSALRHWSWILMACMILGSGFWYVTARIPTLAESVPNGLPHEALPNGTGPVLRPVEQTAKHETGDSAAVETRLSSVAEAALPKELGAAKPESPGLPNVPVPIPGTLSGPAPTSAYSARAPNRPRLEPGRKAYPVSVLEHSEAQATRVWRRRVLSVKRLRRRTISGFPRQRNPPFHVWQSVQRAGVPGLFHSAAPHGATHSARIPPGWGCGPSHTKSRCQESCTPSESRTSAEGRIARTRTCPAAEQMVPRPQAGPNARRHSDKRPPQGSHHKRGAFWGPEKYRGSHATASSGTRPRPSTSRPSDYPDAKRGPAFCRPDESLRPRRRCGHQIPRKNSSWGRQGLLRQCCHRCAIKLWQ